MPVIEVFDKYFAGYVEYSVEYVMANTNKIWK